MKRAKQNKKRFIEERRGAKTIGSSGNKKFSKKPELEVKVENHY